MLKKLVAVGAALVALTIGAVAWAGPGANEPQGATQLISEPWNTFDRTVNQQVNGWNNNYTYCDGFIVSDGEDGALRQHRAAGSLNGGCSISKFYSPAVTKLYGKMDLTLSAPFYGVNAGTHKITGYLVQQTTGNNIRVDIRGPVGGPFTAAVGFNAPNVDNCHLRGSPGFINPIAAECSGPGANYELLANVPNVNVPVVAGQRVRLEWKFELGTCPNCQDGKVIFYVNGVKVGEWLNFNHAWSPWNGWSITHTWDGQPQQRPEVESWIDIHDVYLSTYNQDSGTVTPLEQCRDGADNDGDGKTDYPSDPGCSSAVDNLEADDPPVQDGLISLNPTSITTSVVAGATKQVALSLSKTGTTQSTWQPQSSTSWISTSPALSTSNTISTETDTLTVTLSAVGKTVGQYTGTLTVLENGSRSINVPITMNVVEEGPQFDRGSATRCASPCTDATLSHTVGSGSDRVIYVTVDWFATTTTTITPVKFDGVDATYVDGIVNTSCPYFCGSQIWRLVAPNEGTHNITVHSSNPVNMIVSGLSFFGVHQTVPEGTAQKATGQSLSPSVTLSSGTDEMVVGTLSIVNAGGSLSGGPGISLSSNQYDSGGFIQSLSGYMQGASSVDFKGVYSTSQKFSIVAVPIKPSTPVDPGEPDDPPPTSPSITSVSGGGVVDFTHDGADLAGFNVYFSASSGQTKTNVGLGLSPSARTFTYSAGCYQLSAYDAGGNESALSAEVCSTAATVAAPTSLLTTSVSSLRVVDGRGTAWELRGSTLPYMLYQDGDCGRCRVVGYSLRYNTTLQVVEVELLPGKFIRYDYSINDWVILQTTDSAPGQTVSSMVSGTYNHDGVNVAGFFVYRSNEIGQTKTKLDIALGPSARVFSDRSNTFGCYEVAGYDGTGQVGPRSNESCTSSSPTGPLDVGRINALKVIDFVGRTWELQGASAPYVLYRDGVCECSILGYSLQYKAGVVEVEDLPGHWIRRDEALQDWVVVAPPTN